MKQILKEDEPERLLEWKRNNAAFDDVHYDAYGFPKNEVKASLLSEQGFICAYTMLRVSAESSHIEHLKPRSVSKNEEPPRYDETVAYDNLVACYPKSGVRGQPSCPFGAELRGSWWDPELFVMPLDEDCESRFRFLPDGTVESANEGDIAAQETIKKLGLGHTELQQLRRDVFNEEGVLVTSSNSLSEEDARTLSTSIIRRIDGKFSEFAIAIKQVAIDYADRLLAAKSKAIPEQD